MINRTNFFNLLIRNIFQQLPAAAHGSISSMISFHAASATYHETHALGTNYTLSLKTKKKITVKLFLRIRVGNTEICEHVNVAYRIFVTSISLLRFVLNAKNQLKRTCHQNVVLFRLCGGRFAPNSRQNDLFPTCAIMFSL